MGKQVQRLAAEEGFDAIQPIDGAFYVNPVKDITDRVAKRYDQGAAAASVDEVQALRDKVAAMEAKQGSPPLAKK
jgi:hypothetical protein